MGNPILCTRRPRSPWGPSRSAGQALCNHVHLTEERQACQTLQYLSPGPGTETAFLRMAIAGHILEVLPIFRLGGLSDYIALGWRTVSR